MKELVWMIFSIMGGGLFGLDIGVVGSVIDMKDFKERFEHVRIFPRLLHMIKTKHKHTGRLGGLISGV